MFVCRFTQKVLDRLSHNLVGGCGRGQRRTHSIIIQIWIRGRIQLLLLHFFSLSFTRCKIGLLVDLLEKWILMFRGLISVTVGTTLTPYLFTNIFLSCSSCGKCDSWVILQWRPSLFWALIPNSLGLIWWPSRDNPHVPCWCMLIHRQGEAIYQARLCISWGRHTEGPPPRTQTSLPCCQAVMSSLASHWTIKRTSVPQEVFRGRRSEGKGVPGSTRGKSAGLAFPSLEKYDRF